MAPTLAVLAERSEVEKTALGGWILRDGTVLCPDFQKGKCGVSARECPKGAHRCGRTLTTGRVCGSYGHNPKSCSNRKKA